MDGAYGRNSAVAPLAEGRAWACRLLATVGLAILVSALLAGCSVLPVAPVPTEALPAVESTPTPAPTDALPPGVTLLVFWEPFPLDRPQGILLGEMVREFEAQNSDVKVEFVPKEGYIGIYDSIVAELPDGELPDLAVAFPSMIAEIASSGMVAPLDPYLYDPEVGLTDQDLADLYPVHLAAGKLPDFGDQLLAFPFVQNAIGMWVNEDLLATAGWEQPPATWAEFEQACFDVSTVTGERCYPFIESVSTFNAWLYSRGGTQLDNAAQKATFNGQAGVESLALLRRMMDSGLARRPEEPFGDYTAFANGQAAMTFSSTGSTALYADAYQGAVQNGLAPFRWRQVLVPQSDPDKPATAMYGASFFVLQGDLVRQRAAWRFIRWFSEQKQTARWASGLEALPVRASALEVMTGTLEAYPFVRAQVRRIMPFARPEPAVARGLEVRDLLYTAIFSVTQGYLDPQTALDQTARKVDAVLSGQR